MNSKTRLAYLGLFLAFGSYALLSVLDHVDVLTENFGYQSLINFLLFTLLLSWALKVETLNPSAMGIKSLTVGTFIWGAIGAVAIFVVMGGYYYLLSLFGFAQEVPEMARDIASQNIIIIFLLCLSISLFEELLFRAYGITRLYTLSGNKWLAWAMPIIAFSALHIPMMGWGQLIPVLLGAIVFTWLFWIKRDYWCNVLAHFLVNFAAFGAVISAKVG